jgi:2-methylisocitrate lyase-like PEP mutase family enzyme
MSKGRRLKELLREKRFLITPGITTPLHAMIVEKTGFDYVYVGGYDVSLTLLGLPDVGLITETEMLNNARHIARSVSLPVIADVDTGYGNAINVIRTVQNFEAAGVAAIHIEDQVSPKRCGHVAGKIVVSLEEAVGKLQAALDARRDPDFMIIGRTDAVAAAGGGLDEAIRRGKAFSRIGCDMVWAEFPTADIEQPKRFAAEVLKEFPGVPLYLNYSANLKWSESNTTFEDFAAMGYKAMHTSLAGLRATMQATWDYAMDLKARGAQAEIDFQKRLAGHPMGAFNEFAGFPRIKQLEAKYLAPEEARKKYDGAIGL